MTDNTVLLYRSVARSVKSFSKIYTGCAVAYLCISRLNCTLLVFLTVEVAPHVSDQSQIEDMVYWVPVVPASSLSAPVIKARDALSYDHAATDLQAVSGSWNGASSGATISVLTGIG